LSARITHKGTEASENDEEALDNVCMQWYIVCRGVFLFAPRQSFGKSQTRTQGDFGSSE
jgi:hypothetical protein